jgi:hypothetical protein
LFHLEQLELGQLGDLRSRLASLDTAMLDEVWTLCSTGFWTHFGSPKLNTPLLETTHPCEVSNGRSRGLRFPFQFIDARRGPSKASGPRLRGRKCQRCPIVLRAWNKLSACIPHGQSSRSHSSLAGLVHLSRFRPGWAVFVRATVTIGRLQMPPSGLSEVCQVTPGFQFYLYSEIPQGGPLGEKSWLNRNFFDPNSS